MERPNGVVDFAPAPQHYPFESHWFDSSVGPVHFIDEGQGRPLLLLHGNPDWSFIYRKIVLGLRDRFRCIAPDYPGFGLSVHPGEPYAYTPGEHAAVMAELVDHLDLTDVIVMGQDWGGPIGLDVATRMPTRIGGLVMGNTWFWPADSLAIRAFSLTMGSPPIQALIRRRNFFVTTVMRRSLRVKLNEAEFAHYTAVAPTPESRRGMAVFPRQIRADAWHAELERRVMASLADKPVVLLWGMRDPAFSRGGMLERWQATFPQARLTRLEGAGHFIQEDAPDEIVAAIAAAFDPGAGTA